MDTRKITLIATIAAIALVAVGIGYAYTATTTNSTNTVVNEYATIQIADSSDAQAYTTTTNINIEYNTKTVYDSQNSQTKFNYDVTSNEDLTAVKKISLEAFNNGTSDVSKNVTSLTITLHTSAFSSNGYNASTNFIATLTGTVNSTSHTWVGSWSSDANTTTWTFSKSNEAQESDQIYLVAGAEGHAIEYTLTLQLKASTGYPFTVTIPEGTYTIDFLATV